MRFLGLALAQTAVFFAALVRGAHAADSEAVREVEADDAFRGNLNLLATRDSVDADTRAAAGRCADGRALSAAEDAAEDRSGSRADAGLGGGVLAAALA